MITTIADLISFLRRFHRHWLKDPSLNPVSIPDGLPDGLSRIYRELGALVELKDGLVPFAAQDSLVPVSRLKRFDGMIEFAWESQGNWSCRCPLGPSDPPVYSDAPDLYHEEKRGFVEVCSSLDHFLTTLCLQEAVMSCRDLYSLPDDPPLETLMDLGFLPLWLEGKYVDDEPTHDFYLLPDSEALLLKHRHEGLFLGTNAEEGFEGRLAGAGVRASRISA